jgi:hypothetical protein
MEVENSSEILLTIYKIAWCHNPEDHNQHFHLHENLKSLNYQRTPDLIFIKVVNLMFCSVFELHAIETLAYWLIWLTEIEIKKKEH